MSLGMNALTPEQRQQMQVQQARLARGQMPDLQQGYGGNYISRA